MARLTHTAVWFYITRCPLLQILPQNHFFQKWSLPCFPSKKKIHNHLYWTVGPRLCCVFIYLVSLRLWAAEGKRCVLFYQGFYKGSSLFLALCKGKSITSIKILLIEGLSTFRTHISLDLLSPDLKWMKCRECKLDTLWISWTGTSQPWSLYC